jgi:hypothetical protein
MQINQARAQQKQIRAAKQTAKAQQKQTRVAKQTAKVQQKQTRVAQQTHADADPRVAGNRVTDTSLQKRDQLQGEPGGGDAGMGAERGQQAKPPGGASADAGSAFAFIDLT